MSIASELLVLYVEAEKKILLGQSVVLGDRTLTMANLSDVRAEREKLERRVSSENSAASGSSMGSARYCTADFS